MLPREQTSHSYVHRVKNLKASIGEGRGEIGQQNIQERAFLTKKKPQSQFRKVEEKLLL